MTFRVIRTGNDEIDVRNDDDDDLISFKVFRGPEPHGSTDAGSGCRPISDPVDRPTWIDAARRVAEAEAKRLGWL
jgi:hypothetical protein